MERQADGDARTAGRVVSKTALRCVLCTPASSVMLVFSIEELERCRTLLAQAGDGLLREKLFRFQLT